MESKRMRRRQITGCPKAPAPTHIMTLNTFINMFLLPPCSLQADPNMLCCTISVLCFHLRAPGATTSQNLLYQYLCPSGLLIFLNRAVNSITQIPFQIKNSVKKREGRSANNSSQGHDLLHLSQPEQVDKEV